MTDDQLKKPYDHCGTTTRPRDFDQWDNWLCNDCAEREAEAEWDEI